jgi:hypothetical protein
LAIIIFAEVPAGGSMTQSKKIILITIGLLIYILLVGIMIFLETRNKSIQSILAVLTGTAMVFLMGKYHDRLSIPLWKEKTFTLARSKILFYILVGLVLFALLVSTVRHVYRFFL